MPTQLELRQNAQKVFDRIRMNLLQSLDVGSYHKFSHGTPRSSHIPRSVYSQVDQGHNFLNGVMPNDAQIAAYVNEQPEYKRAVAALEKAGKAGAGKANSRRGQVSSMNGAMPPAAPSESMQLYNNWLAQQQAGFDEAKAANEARYAEGHGELSGARDYRQGLYANFGYAAQEDIDERMQEALKSARASAQRRGLSNTNVTDAYALRAARDTAREQQRVRETRDSRMADAYAQDTGNLVGFIERREDPYPDMNQAVAIGIQLAEGEANRQAQAERMAAINQYRRTGGRGRSDARLPPLPGPQGGVSPVFMNGTPVQQAYSMFANRGPMPAYSSNRYPARRSPEEYAAIQAQQQQQGVEDDRNRWMSGRRMLPTYQPPVPQLQLPGGPPQRYPVYA